MKDYEHDAAIIEAAEALTAVVAPGLEDAPYLRTIADAADNFCEATESITDGSADARDELPALYAELLDAVLAAKAHGSI